MEAVVADVAATKWDKLITVKFGKPIEHSKGRRTRGTCWTLKRVGGALAAHATPSRLEDWAGPVAGLSDIG